MRESGRGAKQAASRALEGRTTGLLATFLIHLQPCVNYSIYDALVRYLPARRPPSTVRSVGAGMNTRDTGDPVHSNSHRHG